jgi:hypothetical protein
MTFAPIEVVEMNQNSTPIATSPAPTEAPRPRRWLGILVAFVILTPSLCGFGMKFIEFLHLFRGDSQGAFAVAPIVNYLLASSGFLLLFGWAAANGMFHDIERPKYTLLEHEAELDARSARQSI